MTNLPSLHQLSIDTLYPEELLREFNKEKAKYTRRIAVEDEKARRMGTTPNNRYWYDRLLRSESDIEVVNEFIKKDFGDVPLCAATKLKGCLRRAVRQSLTLSRLSTTPIHDYITNEEFFVEIDNEQSERITREYQRYVQTHEDSPLVELWTREDSEEALDRGYRSAPHQIFDYYMLDNVGVRSGAAANFDMSDPLAAGGTPTWNKIRDLYQLVIDAPRAPIPLQLFRTVRNKERMPQKWFRRWVKREMVPGDSVIAPTFLSTTLHDVNQNWEMYGHGSPQAEDDERPSEKECCIMRIFLSKGVPMLPLGDFKSNAHAYEDEVLLPPGIQLVLINVGDLYVGPDFDSVNTFTFLARLVAPPTQDD